MSLNFEIFQLKALWYYTRKMLKNLGNTKKGTCHNFDLLFNSLYFDFIEIKSPVFRPIYVYIYVHIAKYRYIY